MIVMLLLIGLLIFSSGLAVGMRLAFFLGNINAKIILALIFFIVPTFFASLLTALGMKAADHLRQISDLAISTTFKNNT